MSTAPEYAGARWWEEIRPQVVVVALFCLLLLALSLQNRVTDSDFWWQLRTGQWIIEQGRIPHQDSYSYTAAGQPWIAHSWLADVGMYLLYHYAGPFSLHPLRALLHTASFALLFILVWQRWPRLGPAMGLLLVAFVASARFWLTRPNSLSLAFCIAYLYLWHLYKYRGRDRLWLLPLLMLLWANLHSGFIYGIFLLGALFLGEVLAGRFWPDQFPLGRKRWLRLGLFFLLCILAVPVNPYGFRLLLYPFSYYLGSITLHTHFVGEWLSPDFHGPADLLFALLLLLLLAGMAWRRSGMVPAEALAVGLFTLLSLRSVRVEGVAIPLLAYAVAGVFGQEALPRVGVGRQGAWPRPQKAIMWAWRAGTLVVLLLLLAAVGWEFATWGRRGGFVGEDGYPQQAVTALAAMPPSERMFNSYNWGGYIIWRLPDHPVFIDGRADLYGDPLFGEYLKVWKLDPSWGEVLRRWQVQVVICERPSALATLLAESPSWEQVYADSTAAVFRRAP